jgi:hypothetical protein
MARPVTTLVIFFVAFNLFAGVLMSTGAAAAIGIDADVGGDEAVTQRTGDTEVQGGSGQGDTLADLRNVLVGQVSDLFGVIFPGLAMLERIGVPNYITGGILGPLFSVMITIAVLSFFRGWGL